MEMRTPRGTRDLLAPEKLLKNSLIDTLKETFEEYGFDPIETPGIELLEILTSKYAGGAEILKEVYKFQDQGGRDLALRFDHTVPMARLIAANKNLSMPFKRYAIGPVWRDGPIKIGRLREFWQCDVDIVGSSSQVADAEIVSLTASVFNKLGFDVVVKVNNRKLLNAIVKEAGVDDAKVNSAILSIDKLLKVGLDGVQKELKEKGISQKSIDKISETLALKISKKNLKDLNKIVKSNEGKDGIKELQQLFDLVESAGFGNSVEFDISLARGLAYYTGTVYEGFLKNSKMTSSVCGGGRWDNMIGKFQGSKDQVPAVGIAFGLDAIIEALKADGKTKEVRTVTEILVVPINTEKESFKVASQIRTVGKKVEVDLMNRSLKRNLNYANNQGIEYVVIVGEKELKNKKVVVKNMTTGKQEEVSLEKLTSFFSSF